jgi:hypothetical protein
MHHLHVLAGIAWNPGIRGILVVLTGFAVLCGSTYLLLATNMGARLAMLVAFAGLFGWLSILTATWWIQPPAIGPRGQNPSWHPVEVYIDDPSTGPAKTQVIDALPRPEALPTVTDIINANPDLAKDFPTPETASLSDVESSHPDEVAAALKDAGVDLNGWKITPASAAGEAQAAADVALVTSSQVFKATTDYKKLSVFEIGGKKTRAEYCPNDATNGQHNIVPGDWLCRIEYKFYKLFTFNHPTHYAVVQVQPVIPQEAKAGQAPPIPKVDPTKPVYYVVMVRDLGTVRLLPATFFAVSFALFIFFVVVLHYRDKTLTRNLAEAKALEKV